MSDTVVGLIFGTYPFVVFAFSPICGALVSKIVALRYNCRAQCITETLECILGRLPLFSL